MGNVKSVDGVNMHLENKSVSKKFFWTLWIMYAVVYMTKNCYSAAMASIVHEGVLTKSQTGLISAAFYFVYAPFQILGGVFADKYNPEKMIKIGLVGGGIANLIIYFNQNYYVMLFTWIFNAVIQFALWPGVFKIISSQLEREYRLKGIYLIAYSSIFGLLLAYVVAAIVPKWQHNFIISAVSLFLFGVLFHIACNKVEKHMVPDKQERKIKGKTVEMKTSIWRLFWVSGFMLMIVVTAMRTIVENGVKTLSATMLMESYEHISPALGNLLNTLIIIAGVIGVAFVNQFIYPRLIRDEAVAKLVLLGVTMIPLMVLTLLGKAPVYFVVVSLCIVAAILSGITIITSRCTACFGRYGKNGLASGVVNSAASVAIMIQNYGITYIADHAGWKMVVWFLLGLLFVSALCIGIAVPLWKNFKTNPESCSRG